MASVNFSILESVTSSRESSEFPSCIARGKKKYLKTQCLNLYGWKDLLRLILDEMANYQH